MNNTKFGHVLNVLYALITTFAIVGGVVRPGELPLAILIVTVLMWATTRIIATGAMSLFALLGRGETDEK